MMAISWKFKVGNMASLQMMAISWKFKVGNMAS